MTSANRGTDPTFRLLGKMPRQFSCPAHQDASSRPTLTSYVVVTGPGRCSPVESMLDQVTEAADTMAVEVETSDPLDQAPDRICDDEFANQRWNNPAFRAITHGANVRVTMIGRPAIDDRDPIGT